MPKKHIHKQFSFDEWIHFQRQKLDEVAYYKRVLHSLVSDKDLYKYKTTTLDRVLVDSSVASIALVLDGIAENLAKETALAQIKHIQRIKV